MNELIAQLIEFLKTASPALWATLIKQVYVFAVGDFVWGILFVIAIYFGVRFMKHAIRKFGDGGDWDKDYSEVVLIPLGFAIGLSVIIALILFNNAIMFAVNSDYYAIKMIIERLTP